MERIREHRACLKASCSHLDPEVEMLKYRRDRKAV
jgi:hypothetical protein